MKGWPSAKYRTSAVALICAVLFYTPVKAYAACSSPDGVAGDIFMNADYAIMQFCDNSIWRGLGDIAFDSSAGNLVSPPTGCPIIGNLCSDGSYYIGQIGGENVYATAVGSEANLPWNNGSTSWTTTGVTSFTNGSGNTSTLVALSDAGAPYQAAEYCDDLSAHSRSDWYMPALNELELFWSSGSPVAGIKNDGTFYNTSTEEGSDSVYWRNNGGEGWGGNKHVAAPVRCVRRHTDVGDNCNNPTLARGTLFYNSSESVLEYCNGIDWIGLGVPVVGGSSGINCSNPTAPEGTIFYNSAAKRHQYCNGDEWMGFILAHDGTAGIRPSAFYDFEIISPFDQGDTGSFSLLATAARNGSQGLRVASGGTFKAVHSNSISYSAAESHTFSVWVKPVSTGDPVNASLSGVLVGNDGGAAANGYIAVLDLRAGGSLQIREDADYNSRVEQAVSLTSGTWYWLEVTWTSTGIIAQLFSAPGGALLQTATKNDTSYSSGYVGLVGYGGADFDDYTIE